MAQRSRFDTSPTAPVWPVALIANAEDESSEGRGHDKFEFETCPSIRIVGLPRVSSLCMTRKCERQGDSTDQQSDIKRSIIIALACHPSLRDSDTTIDGAVV